MASDGDDDLLWAMEHPGACSTCRSIISRDNRCRCSPEPGPNEFACIICGIICRRGFGPASNVYCYTHGQLGRQ